MPQQLADPVSLALAAIYVAFLGLVAVHDARHRRIPNAWVYPAIAAAALTAPLRPGEAWAYLAAGLVAGGALVTLAVVSRGGMGMGDAKLAVVVGLVAGWPGMPVALLAAFVFGTATALGLLATRRLGRAEPLPFAPALAAGALVALVGGQKLATLLWPGLA